jgi:hypothetical protein
MDLVSTMIRSDITLFDDAIEARDAAVDDRDDGSDSGVNEDSDNARITHGSVQRNITFSDLESNHSEDAAFRNFRVRLAGALAIRLDVDHVNLRADDVVSVIESIFVH